MFVHPTLVREISQIVVFKTFAPWEGGDDAASRGEVHRIAPIALLFTRTGSFHSHLIFGFSRKAGELSVCGGGIHIDVLPCTGGNVQADGHIVDMQVVVTVRYLGFTIKSNPHGLTNVGREVNVHILAGSGDIIIYVG